MDTQGQEVACFLRFSELNVVCFAHLPAWLVRASVVCVCARAWWGLGSSSPTPTFTGSDKQPGLLWPQAGEAQGRWP